MPPPSRIRSRRGAAERVQRCLACPVADRAKKVPPPLELSQGGGGGAGASAPSPGFKRTAQGQLGTIDASPRNHFLAIAASMLRNIPSIASARWQSQQKELRDDQAALPERGSGLFELLSSGPRVLARRYA
jgi:hypothetical protein